MRQGAAGKRLIETYRRSDATPSRSTTSDFLVRRISDDIGLARHARPRPALAVSAAIVVVLAVATVAIVIRLSHRHGDEATATDRGLLTSQEYATAVRLARSEIAKDHATVSSAVATLVSGRVRQPNLATGCTSGRLLVVTLVGDFPEITVSPAPGSPTGPDMWVTLKADPATGVACLEGVGVGQFKTPAGSANLSPAL